MLSTPTVKTERIEARIHPDQKDTLQQAADILGVSLASFLIDSAQTRAHAIIQEHTRILLSARDSQTFVNALLEQPTPNQSLRDAAKLYKELARG